MKTEQLPICLQCPHYVYEPMTPSFENHYQTGDHTCNMIFKENYSYYGKKQAGNWMPEVIAQKHTENYTLKELVTFNPTFIIPTQCPYILEHKII